MTAAMTLPITVPFITPSPPHPTLPLIAPVIAPSPPCPLPAPWLSSPSLSPLLFQPPHFPITASTTSSSLGQTLQLPWTDEDAGCGEVGKEQERTERGAVGVGYTYLLPFSLVLKGPLTGTSPWPGGYRSLLLLLSHFSRVRLCATP